MIQVIDRALDILEYVAYHENGAGLSLKEISTQLSLNQATCANIIKSLTNRKYLEHIGPKKGFRLGPMSTFLIGNYAIRPLLVLASKDIIDKLTAELNENCLLGIIHHDKRLLVYSTTIDHDLGVRNKPERNVYETASGRLLLSYMSPSELDQFMKKQGLPDKKVWPEATSNPKLIEQLNQIRKKEMVVTRSSSHVVGVAVPVKKGDATLAALSTYLPESRFTKEAQKKIETKIRKAAADISSKLNNG